MPQIGGGNLLVNIGCARVDNNPDAKSRPEKWIVLKLRKEISVFANIRELCFAVFPNLLKNLH